MAPLPSLVYAMGWMSLFSNVSALRGPKLDEQAEERHLRRTRVSNNDQARGYTVTVVTPTAEATSQTPNQNIACPTEPFDTIIIGAGMAGLSAARVLKDAGVSYVQLERSDRVGGRMMSAKFGDEKVEKGK